MSGSTGSVNDQIMEEILGDFLDESTELLQNLNARLLQLDEWARLASEAQSPRPDPDLLNEMFRAAHSLKGLSGMLRLDNVNGLTHRMENLLDAARNAELTVTAETVDVFFKAVDRLEGMIEALRAEEQDDGDSREVIEAIEQMLAREGALKDAASQHDVERRLAEASVEALAACAATAPDSPLPTSAPAAAENSQEDPLHDVRDDEDIPPKYLAIFVDESELTLDEFSETLLAEPGSSATESLLVSCHRLKGSAASIGLQRVARLAHCMEDLLQDCRRNERAVPTDAADAMLKCADAIRSFVGGVRTGVPCDFLSDAYRQLLLAISQAGENDSLPTSPAVAGACSCGGRHVEYARGAAPSNQEGCLGHVVFEPGLALTELKARLLLERLHQAGSLFYCHPLEDELDRAAGVSCLTFGLVSSTPAEQLRQSLSIDGIAVFEIASLTCSSSSTGAVLKTSASEDGSPAPVAERTNPAASSAIDGPAESTPSAAGAGADAAPAAKSKPTETLRVDIDRLDQLMNLAGQLVINRARFGQIEAKLKEFSAFKSTLHSATAVRQGVGRLAVGIDECCESFSSSAMEELRALAVQMRDDVEALQYDLGQLAQMRTALNDLSEAVHQLDRVSDGIQTTVMDTRMVPIGPLFSRFKRVVRDLTRTSNKRIELVIMGESTELDKRMIDELGDPLIHLIRNSADHGIEAPDVRAAAGKNPQGKITLNAFHRGNRIVIQISDDGRGLDADRIVAKALSKGLIKEGDVERMTPQQIYQLIWQPGFSTAERITEVSGRGMGMDIVLSKIEQLNGAVELRSAPGVGTTFEIKLPLTMAILPSLLIVIDGDVFAIPVESVVEIVRLAQSEIRTLHGQPTARVRNRVVSVVELNNVFQWNREPAAPATPTDDCTLVIIGADGNEIGLRVDSLLGEQDIVIKSMEDNFQNVNGVAGASILGDGRVSLILDVTALLEMAQRSPQANRTLHGAFIQPENEPAIA